MQRNYFEQRYINYKLRKIQQMVQNSLHLGWSFGTLYSFIEVKQDATPECEHTKSWLSYIKNLIKTLGDEFHQEFFVLYLYNKTETRQSKTI